VRWLGRLAYDEAWDLQRALHEGRASGRSDDDYLLLLEHPHTYTVGRRGDGSNLLTSPEGLERLGAVVRRVDRGGDVTYHGPGQLVGYPIVHLGLRPAMAEFVHRLERALVVALGDLGVAAWTEDGLAGVWTEQGKVAAVGTRLARRVTMHGFALNVGTDLDYFRHIVPCGIAERPVTSVSRILGRPVSLEEAVGAVVPRFADAFGGEADVQLGAFARGAGNVPAPFEVDRLLAAGAFSPERRREAPATSEGRLPGEPERPSWMRVKADLSSRYRRLRGLLRGFDLHTVCEEAGCPNIYECWAAGTATFMILGDVCTRACSFCDVTTGRPGAVDAGEPARVAEAVAALGIDHAVITSVNRDDLPDGGAAAFAATITEIRRRVPGCEVEVLVPDFKGDPDALATVLAAGPDVLNHNTETVLRLQREVRTAADYGRSLALLARARRTAPVVRVKSGLIVGLGERRAEVLGALADLRAVGVDIVTIGQYLRPTARHRPVHRYVAPEEFAVYRAHGRALGIPHVAAGPLVRSSYRAREAAEAVARA
jgi:lipoic acid synthetase